MLKKILHFIQYNNLTVLILAIILIAGSGAFAATEAGQELIGQKGTEVQGIDNTLLLETDLDRLDMDFKIERIEEDALAGDEGYYYVTYTYLDIVLLKNAWQYQMQEKTRRVPKRLRQDLGQYLAEELKEQYEARIKDLKPEQAKARETGQETRREVTAYGGLIGVVLDLAGRAFPGYEPVTVRQVPSPSVPPTVLLSQTSPQPSPSQGEGVADSMTDIYQEYINENDPDGDDVFSALDNCPLAANPDQADADGDGTGDACEEVDDGPGETDFGEATTTDEAIIEAPAEEAPAEAEATVEEEAPAEEPEVEVVDLSS